MFRIRRVWDDVVPGNRRALAQVRTVLVDRFDGLSQREAGRVQDRLRNPLEEGLRPILLVAEGAKHRVRGAAVVLHDPELDFALVE